ncbi:MAG TPA: NADAR family protein [Alphaproteobacteria bacterium]|nr:NADAR family protein [Alphaproteobacteria bacterium]
MPSSSDANPSPSLADAGDRPVRRFQGADRYLSNMYYAAVAWGDAVTPLRLWPLNELPYVLAKTLSPEARAEGMELFRAVEQARPGAGGAAINRWGKDLVLRPDWDRAKDAVMLALVRDKFARNAGLKALLLASGNGLIEEGNDWGDLYWGVALKGKPKRGIKAGDGQNKLGKILMQVRDELRRGEVHLAAALEAGTSLA